MKTTPIEDFVQSLAITLREKLAQIETLREFHLDISISGRVHGGELKMGFKLSEHSWGNNVEGGSYDAVLQEFMRRHGWSQVNQPLMLSYSGDLTPESEALPNA